MSIKLGSFLLKGALMTTNPILITGSAGFIGYHLAERLLRDGHSVIGIDNLNDYYDVNLKQARLMRLQTYTSFTFHPIAIEDRVAMELLFNQYTFSTVINLAAQAGVRYSLENPHTYIESNIVGFMNVLEASRQHKIGHL